MIDDGGDNKTSSQYFCSRYKYPGIVFGLNSAQFGLLINEAERRKVSSVIS